MFQYCIDDTEIELQFQDQNVHFLLKNKTTIHPGQITSLYFNFVTNTQAVPDLSTNLDDNLAISPDLQFAPQLCIGTVHLANCSEDILELFPSTPILSLKFSTDQIMGIKRDINSILDTQIMDSNIINYHFLRSKASCISKQAVKGYIEDHIPPVQENKLRQLFNQMIPRETMRKITPR